MMFLLIRLMVVFLCLLLGMVDQILNTSEVSRIMSPSPPSGGGGTRAWVRGRSSSGRARSCTS